MKSAAIRSIAIVVICAAMLVVMDGYVYDTWTKEPASSAPVTEAQTVEEKGIDHAPWSELKTKYKDVVGFLQIGGTNINDVVVQGKDNDFYLRRAADGSDKYVHEGCYFADYRCFMGWCQNTIIYGHNLWDETRKFGQLEKYRNLDFYKQNPVIYFDTPNAVGKWKIVAVFMTNSEKEDGVKFYYRDREYQTQEQFLYFIERCRRRSLIDCPVDVKENDRILTLSTCDYELNSGGHAQGRFVVIARKVRPGEDESVDVASAKLNDNPLMPEGYYKKYGGTMPKYDDEPLLADQK